MEPLKDVVSYLVSLEEQVSGVERVYKWRPIMPPEFPSFYNALRTGRFERRDTGTKKWIIGIDCVLLESVNDPQEGPERMTPYADDFIEITDAALWNEPPLWINMAKLVDMRSGQEDFAGTLARTITWQTEIELAEPIR